jgi:phospholipase C
VLASSFLPPALARAASEGPRRGSLRDVKHVVIQMQENRSFDHYFGTLGGVAGFGDPNALVQTDPTAPFDQVQGKSIFYQYDPYNPDNYLLPWHLDTLNTSSQAIPSTSHAWYYQQPWNTAFSSDGFTAYVTNSNDNTVSVINTATQKVTKRSRSVRSPTPTPRRRSPNPTRSRPRSHSPPTTATCG